MSSASSSSEAAFARYMLSEGPGVWRPGPAVRCTGARARDGRCGGCSFPSVACAHLEDGSWDWRTGRTPDEKEEKEDEDRVVPLSAAHRVAGLAPSRGDDVMDSLRQLHRAVDAFAAVFAGEDAACSYSDSRRICGPFYYACETDAPLGLNNRPSATSAAPRAADEQVLIFHDDSKTAPAFPVVPGTRDATVEHASTRSRSRRSCPSEYDRTEAEDGTAPVLPQGYLLSGQGGGPYCRESREKGGKEETGPVRASAMDKSASTSNHVKWNLPHSAEGGKRNKTEPQSRAEQIREFINCRLPHIRKVSPTLADVVARALVPPFLEIKASSSDIADDLHTDEPDVACRSNCALCSGSLDGTGFIWLWKIVASARDRGAGVHPSLEICCPLFMILRDMSTCGKGAICAEESFGFIARNLKEVGETRGFLRLDLRAIRLLLRTKAVLATEEILFESCMRWTACAQPVLKMVQLETLLSLFRFSLFKADKLESILSHPMASCVPLIGELVERSQLLRPTESTTSGPGSLTDVRFDVSRVICANVTSPVSSATLMVSHARFPFIAKGYAWEVDVAVDKANESNDPDLRAHLRCLRCDGAKGSAHTRASKTMVELRTSFQFRLYHACNENGAMRMCAQTDVIDVDVWSGMVWHGFYNIVCHKKLLRLIARNLPFILSVEIKSARARFADF